MIVGSFLNVAAVLRKSGSPMRNISGVVTREPTAAATALRVGGFAIEYKTRCERLDRVGGTGGAEREGTGEVRTGRLGGSA